MKAKIIKALQASKGAVLSAHVNPDGDAIGALVGMATLCGFLHVPYTVLLESIPQTYKKFLEGTQVSSEPMHLYDTFISVDCGEINRLGSFAAYFKEAHTTINIDHHVTNIGFGMYNEVQAQASSTCEVVFDILEMAKCPLMPEVVASLYAGILTDTGGFMHSSTSSHTHEVASKLLAYDFDFTNVYYSLIYEKTQVVAQMEAVAMFNLINKDDVFITYVTKEEMAKFGATKEDLGSIVSSIKVIKGCNLAVFIYPMDEEVYKVSFRSNPPVDVAALAAQFGGGGHVRAAGATLYGNLEAVLSQIETALNF